MNEFERVRLHPHWHGLVAAYGDFFRIIFRGTIYSLLEDFTFTDLEISTVTEQNKITFEASQRKFFRDIEKTDTWLILAIGGSESEWAVKTMQDHGEEMLKMLWSDDCNQ